MANPYRNTGKAGSPAHFIGPVGRAIIKGAKAFSNTAKQYYKAFTKPKAINQQTPRSSNFKPFHRDGKTYDRKMINEAFEARFKKNPADVPKIEKRTMHTNIMGTKFIGKDVTPSKTTNFGRPDAVVNMRTSMNKSGQYPKTDPWRGSPDLR